MPESRFTDEVLDDIFCYHKPEPDQLPKYEAIREGAKVFAKCIRDNSPGSPDQTVALRKIREAVMVANASIALKGAY